MWGYKHDAPSELKVQFVVRPKYHHDFTPMKLDRISKRATFLVDKAGAVQYAEVLDNAGELPDFDAIKQVIASL